MNVLKGILWFSHCNAADMTANTIYICLHCRRYHQFCLNLSVSRQLVQHPPVICQGQY